MTEPLSFAPAPQVLGLAGYKFAQIPERLQRTRAFAPLQVPTPLCVDVASTLELEIDGALSAPPLPHSYLSFQPISVSRVDRWTLAAVESFVAQHLRLLTPSTTPPLLGHLGLAVYQRHALIVTPGCAAITSFVDLATDDYCFVIFAPPLAHPDSVSVFVDDVCVYEGGSGVSPFSLGSDIGIKPIRAFRHYLDTISPTKYVVDPVELADTSAWVIRQDGANLLQQQILQVLTGSIAHAPTTPGMAGSAKFWYEEVGVPFQHFNSTAAAVAGTIAHAGTSTSLPPQRFRFEVDSYTVAEASPLEAGDRLLVPCITNVLYAPYI